MFTVQEMRVLDANLEHFGVSIESLMEQAGEGVAEVLRRRMDADGKRVLFLCGTGNNAGDGFVAARLLADRAEVAVALVRPRDRVGAGPARTNLERIPPAVALHEPPLDVPALADDADLLVDALLGTGIRGELRDPYRSAVEAANEAGKPILSVDMPSGLGSDTAIRPTVTVALHDRKEGMTPETCGEIEVVDIGIAPELTRRIGPGEMLLYPVPPPDAHKGMRGRVLVVAGGPYTGAPALTGLAAYRMGTDVVHVATPANSHPIVASFSPTLIVHRLSGEHLVPEDVETILALADGKDALAVGPGLGRHPETLEAVRDLLRRAALPFVVDADAIAAVAEDPECLAGKEGVITPHAEEFRRLSGTALEEDLNARVEQVAGFAAELGLTLLQKGRYDVVADGSRAKVNETGSPGMTVGGTGDVLTGLVGSLLGRALPPFDAARVAAFTNGTAGEIAFREMSYGMTATDLLDRIPDVLVEFLSTR